MGTRLCTRRLCHKGTPVITTRIKIIEAFLKEDDALFYEPGHPKELAKTVRILVKIKTK